MADLRDKRLLAVFAHPDDESFCCGGGLRLAADAGVEIHLLCATRGEDGNWHGNPIDHKDIIREQRLAQIRVEELKKAAKILGIAKVEYMGFIDGLLNNRDLPRITRKVENKIFKFSPHVVLTFDRVGISGHIDHTVMSHAAYLAVKGSKGAAVERLYYCSLSSWLEKVRMKDEPVRYPQVHEHTEKRVQYDISGTYEVKKQAVMAHETQKADWKTLIPLWDKNPKEEWYKIAIERKSENVSGAPFF